MAQFLKVNSDAKPVLHVDSASYTNDAVTFTGVVATGTTITVSNPSSTAFVAGQVVTGAGVPAGTVVVSYAAPTLTVTGPTALTVATTSISMVARTMWVAGQVVNVAGPKLAFFYINGTGCANRIDQLLQVVQERATVHMYLVKDADEVHFAVYGDSVWSFATIDAALVAAGFASTYSYSSSTDPVTFWGGIA